MVQRKFKLQPTVLCFRQNQLTILQQHKNRASKCPIFNCKNYIIHNNKTLKLHPPRRKGKRGVLTTYRITKLSNLRLVICQKKLVLTTYRITKLSNLRLVICQKKLVLTTYRITKLSNTTFAICTCVIVLTTYRITKLSNVMAEYTGVGCGFNYLQNNKTLKLL